MRNLSHNVNLIMFHFLFFKYFMVCAYFIHFVLFKYLFCVRFKFIKNNEVMVLISPISGSISAIYAIFQPGRHYLERQTLENLLILFTVMYTFLRKSESLLSMI